MRKAGLLLVLIMVAKTVNGGYSVPSSDSAWTVTNNIVVTATSGDSMSVGTSTANGEVNVVGTVTCESLICNTGDENIFSVGNNNIGTSSINIDSSGTLAKFLNSTIANGNTINWLLGKNSTNTYGKIAYAQQQAGQNVQNYVLMNAAAGNGINMNGGNGAVLVNKITATTPVLFQVRETNKGTGTVAMRVQYDNTGLAGSAMIQFTRALGNVVGSIDILDDPDQPEPHLQYNPFSGGHFTKVENTSVRKYSLLESTGEPLEGYDQLVKTRVTYKRKSKRVFGVYSGKFKDMDTCISLGTGYIWVVNKGQNIRKNDYLMSSDVRGMAEKQDDDILHNYTAAKASENVIWKDGERKRLIACTFHCG